MWGAFALLLLGQLTHLESRVLALEQRVATLKGARRGRALRPFRPARRHDGPAPKN